MKRGVMAGVIAGGIAAVALVAGGVVLVAGDGGGIVRYEREAAARWAHARPGVAPAGAFRATVCASECVVVEAAGLTFLVGAGAGAADGLAQRGLLRRDMDGVLLDDLRLDAIAGLAEVGEAVLAAGRAEPLTVYGPEGVVTVADGVNLMLSGGGDTRLRVAAGEEGADEGASGRVVFDSGVVTIRAFAASGASRTRIYRFDVGERSMIVAGCAARADDIAAAVRGARQAAAVIGAMAEQLRVLEAKAAASAGAAAPAEAECMTMEEASAAMAAARVSAAVIVPMGREVDSVKQWRGIATIPETSTAEIGGAGTVLDFSGKAPDIRMENR